MGTRSDRLKEFDARSFTALALKAARLGAWKILMSGTVVWDRRTREIHGVDPRTSLTPRDTDDLIYPDDRASVQAAIDAAALATGPGFYETEYRINRPSAEPRWVGAFARAIKKHGQVVGFRGVVQDITAHKQAEFLRELLVGEAAHRTRNILGIVQSLARTTLTGAGVSSVALDKFNERIWALARAQSTIFSSHGHAAAQITDVIEQAIKPFAAVGEGRIRTKGPRVRLAPEFVTKFSLVLHELLTNALKYGALSNECGKVEISWHLMESGDAVEMIWREAGGPFVQKREAGFGTQLIYGLMNNGPPTARNEMFNYLPTGIVCQLRLEVLTTG